MPDTPTGNQLQQMQPPHSNEAVLTLNTRTLLFGMLLLGGGTVGGFSSSMLGDGNKIPLEVRQQIDATKQTVDSLASEIRAVSVAVVDIRAEMKSSTRDVVRLDETIKDHERRIREMERKLSR